MALYVMKRTRRLKRFPAHPMPRSRRKSGKSPSHSCVRGRGGGVVAVTALVAVVVAAVLWMPSDGTPVSAHEPEHPPIHLWEDFANFNFWSPSLSRQMRDNEPVHDEDGIAVIPARIDSSVYLLLFFNRSQGLQGSVKFKGRSFDALGEPDRLFVALEYTQLMLVTSLMHSKADDCFEDNARFVILGLGVGSVAGFLHDQWPSAHVDVVDVSPSLVDVSRRWFGFEEDDRMRLVLQDATTVFGESLADQRYDVIMLDAYDWQPRMPPGMTTEAYVASLKQNLNPGGMVVVNLCLPEYAPREVLALIEPYLKHFKEVYLFEAIQNSKVLVALDHDRIWSRQDLVDRWEQTRERCKFPTHVKRGLGYSVRLTDHPHWTSQALRYMHADTNTYHCGNGDLPKKYCDAWAKYKTQL